METRTTEFFTKKVKQIDEKIEDCFKSLKEETIPHLKDYSIDDGAVKCSSKKVGVAEMCYSIEKLERLRAFYYDGYLALTNPIERLVKNHRTKKNNLQ